MNNKLFIPLALHQKLTAYGDTARYEVSGLAMVLQLENKRDFRFTDVMLFKQEADAGETKLDVEDVSVWMVAAIQQGLPLQNVRGWWHFHMGSNDHWSGEQGDGGQIESWNGQCSWMVSLLLTKNGQMRARVDIYNPVRATAELEVIIETPEYEEVKKQCAAEVAEKVRLKPVTARQAISAWLRQRVYTGPGLDEEVEEDGYWLA